MVRLNKFLSSCGICSRRRADALIAAGDVRVNDIVVDTLGYQVGGCDTVTYAGRVVKNPDRCVCVVLNKPVNCITTLHDPMHRRTVADIVDNRNIGRLYPVGRLDRNTTGVLILTNDGDLAHKLSHPSSNVRKVYNVVLDRLLSEHDLVRLRNGIMLDDGPMNVDSVCKRGNIVTIAIHSGRNRVIRRMFEYLEYRVVSLCRTSYSCITTKGLRPGQWRFMTKGEIESLWRCISARGSNSKI